MAVVSFELRVRAAQLISLGLGRSWPVGCALFNTNQPVGSAALARAPALLGGAGGTPGDAARDPLVTARAMHPDTMILLLVGWPFSVIVLKRTAATAKAHRRVIGVLLKAQPAISADHAAKPTGIW